MRIWVVLNDIQIPFQDPPVLNLVLDFIHDLQPHGIILNGDIVDCYSISDYDKDPLEKASLQREIDEAGKLMGKLARINSLKERIWLEGNHEDRLRRLLWRNPELATLKSLSFKRLFNLPDYGFSHYAYGRHWMLGRLMVTHGFAVRSHSAISARAHFDRLGTSCLVGHTHRLGAYYKTNVRGQHVSYENGCLCRLDPKYVQYPDWQQGFSVVHVDEGGFFNTQQIPILNRKCFFYGGILVGKR